MKNSQRSKGSKISTSLLIICILASLPLLPLTSLHPHSKPVLLAPEPGVELISFVASRLSPVLMVYLSSMAYLKDRPSMDDLLLRLEQTWQRPVVTQLSTELLSTAWASLLLLLKALAKATEGGLVADAAVLSCLAVGSVVWLWPVLFAHSEIACRMGLVVSAAEEVKGEEALARAEEMVSGRRVQGFALAAAMAAVERGAEMVCARSWMAGGAVRLGLKFLVWYTCTVFYYECKKGRSGEASDGEGVR